MGRGKPHLTVPIINLHFSYYKAYKEHVINLAENMRWYNSEQYFSTVHKETPFRDVSKYEDMVIEMFTIY